MESQWHSPCDVRKRLLGGPTGCPQLESQSSCTISRTFRHDFLHQKSIVMFRNKGYAKQLQVSLLTCEDSFNELLTSNRTVHLVCARTSSCSRWLLISLKRRISRNLSAPSRRACFGRTGSARRTNRDEDQTCIPAVDGTTSHQL